MLNKYHLGSKPKGKMLNLEGKQGKKLHTSECQNHCSQGYVTQKHEIQDENTTIHLIHKNI